MSIGVLQVNRAWVTVSVRVTLSEEPSYVTWAWNACPLCRSIPAPARLVAGVVGMPPPV